MQSLTNSSTFDKSRPCKRHDSNHTLLAQNLHRAFAKGIRDLGNGWWLFRDGSSCTWKVHVSYKGVSFADRAASTVRDLWLPTDHAISPWEFRFSLQDFLQQFYSLPRRWGCEYEPLTEGIIRSSAQWQESYFRRSTLMPTHTNSEATVVAASLRCFVISSELRDVSNHDSNPCFRREDEFYLRLADVERDPKRGIRPSVEVWRRGLGAESSDSVPQNREMLPQMLQRTLQMAQRLLYRRRPQDWPALFYVICILLLVYDNIVGQLWTEAADEAARETKIALRKLCHLFKLVTGNMQPLTANLDLERYAALVDDNELAVGHYRRMHLMWLANGSGEEDRGDADDFWENLDRFVHAFPCD